MQAPIISATGVSAKMPAAASRRFQTRINRFAGGQEQRFSDLADPIRRYIIRLLRLRGSERADWLNLYMQMRGAWGSFTFLSPLDNLLKYNEQLENAAWTKDASLAVGKNYLLRSEEFDNAAWVKGFSGTTTAPVVTANAVAAPDGTVTAEQIAFPVTDASSESFISQNVTTPPDFTAQTFTISIFLRADSSLTLRMELIDGVGVTAALDPVNITTAWQRFEISGTTPAGATNVGLRLENPVSQAAKTVFAWGAQLEYGSVASDYTKTTTAAVELKIADPFWLAAPSSIDGASFGLNSAFLKRGRQLVNLISSGQALYQEPAILPGGSGLSRTLGLQFAASTWFKRQAASPPTVRTVMVSASAAGALGHESNSPTTVTPGAAWERSSESFRFSAGNPDTLLRLKLEVLASGTVYVFGPQLQLGAVASDYMGENLARPGLLTARFAEDQYREALRTWEAWDLENLEVEEILA